MAVWKCSVCGQELRPIPGATIVHCTGCGSKHSIAQPDTVDAVNTEALLDRGFMALEDGDWLKAERFFEKALNNDAQSGRAYLGQALAKVECASLEQLIRKRKSPPQMAGVPVPIMINRAAEEAIVDQYAIPGFLEPETLRQMFTFDPNYTTEVLARQEQLQAEVRFWEENKLLLRAVQFGDEDLVQQIQLAKARCRAEAEQRLDTAIAHAADRKAKKEAEYATFLQRVEEKAKVLHAEALGRQNIHLAQKETSIRKFRKAMLFIAPTVVAAIGLCLWFFVFSPMLRYNNAQKAMAGGNYDEAITLYEELGDYEDAPQKLFEATYAKAQKCYIEGNYDEAIELFNSVNATTEAVSATFAKAQRCYAEGNFDEAIALLESIADFGEAGALLPTVTYAKAMQCYESGNYDEAIALLSSLGQYGDAAAQLRTVTYSKAVMSLESGDYEVAVALFDSLGMEEDSQVKEACYLYAKTLVGTNDAKAAMLFGRAGDYEDARDQSIALWNTAADRSAIAAGGFHTVAVKENGTVVATGYNEDGQCSVSKWSNIVAVSAGEYHTVGLKADGTVVAVGDNDYGQCKVYDWSNIVAVSTGYKHSVALQANGTVVAAGSNEFEQCQVSDWRNVIAVSAGSYHTVALKADGTVVAVGSDKYGQCQVSDWTDIVAIAAGDYHTLGLKSDGTVVAVGNNKYGQCEVTGWRNIVAISADYHSVGLKSDGTVVAVGEKECGECNVSDWTDIVAIDAGDSFTVAVKSDGTVVAIGNKVDGQCKVSGWKNIKQKP